MNILPLRCRGLQSNRQKARKGGGNKTVMGGGVGVGVAGGGEGRG